MKFLIVLAVAVGIGNAFPAVFLQNTADVQAATQNFLQEYNRLAKLAADAPDIHIYHEDPTRQRIQPASTQHRAQPGVNPLAGLQFYSFSANLGGNNQFQPHQITRSFSPAHQVPVRRPVQQVHRPVQQVHQPVQRVHQPVQRVHQPVQQAPRHQQVVRHVQPSQQPIARWTGPFAHTEAAGVRGLPTDVTPTPEVAAARSAHYAVLVNAYQQAAAHRQQNVV